MKYQEIISKSDFLKLKFNGKTLPGISWARKNFTMPGATIFRNETPVATGMPKKFPRSTKQSEENKTAGTLAATLSRESLGILDALLTKFQYLHPIDITGEVKQILISQDGLADTTQVDKYANEIKAFLLLHDFVFIHSLDVIVNSNGMLLRSSGALSSYEERVRDEEERLRQRIGKNINYSGKSIGDSTITYPASQGHHYTDKVSFIFGLKQMIKQIREKSVIFFGKVVDWSLA